jgi:hypothetical protein
MARKTGEAAPIAAPACAGSGSANP